MSVIQPLNLPKANLRLKRKGDQVFVWCIVRKKELVCTPEEWVRQHLIHHLIEDHNIPLGLIASEHSIQYNGLNKRADIVVYNREQRPVLIVECKAPKVPISQETLFQIAQYNADLQVDYLMLSNGVDHLICAVNKEDGSLQPLEDFPSLS